MVSCCSSLLKLVGLCTIASGLVACSFSDLKPSVGRGYRVPLTGVVVDTEGRAVASRQVVVRCGIPTKVTRHGLVSEVIKEPEFLQRTATDSLGRFSVSALPVGRCSLRVGPSGATQALVTIRRNVLRGDFFVRLVERPRYRYTLTVGGRGTTRRTFEVDEEMSFVSFDHRSTPGVALIRLAKGWIAVNPRSKAAIASKGLEVELGRIVPLPAGRRSPRVFRAGRMIPLRALLGQRSLLWTRPCGQGGAGLTVDLSRVVARYRGLGLASAELVTGCKALDLERTFAKAGALPRAEASAATLRVLSARPAELLLVGPQGRVLWRTRVSPTGRAGRGDAATSRALDYLARSWPLFAATQRVVVNPSASVRGAKLGRLLQRANRKTQRGDFAGAHALLEQAVGISPRDAEVHRRRALTKAALGDLVGAMVEVRWWRDAFGDESAEDLLDAVRKQKAARPTVRSR